MINTLVKLFRNILELIGVLFAFIFSKIEDGIKILTLGRKVNNKVERLKDSWRENIIFPKKEKKDLVYSSIARNDEEKEARVRQLMKLRAIEFDNGLEDEYLYTTGTRWSRDEDYEEAEGAIGI
jgi:hypothetical protein